ncbi:hypothetical protein [Rubritalea marina]|uniref:Dph6-related ATP pyrophosphatase n=1 Tax=Rubritalea marina TaxID=361055 RepID=UPI00036AA5E6|nr:hypothetical protein [Rubritalea marina]
MAEGKTWFHWSGGKDSAYALWKLMQEREVHGLVTSHSSAHKRVSMHGVAEALVEAQATALGLPLHKFYLPEGCSMDDYDAILAREMGVLKAQGATHCAFGDIFLEDLKQYRERQMRALGLQCQFPIWLEAETSELAKRIIDSGIQATIVCINSEKVPAELIGQRYDHKFLTQLPDSVDPCGENGEFHSFVHHAPNFSAPIPITLGKIQSSSYKPADKDEQDDQARCGAKASWDTEFLFQDIQLTD